jgi:hypothetical protein
VQPAESRPGARRVGAAGRKLGLRKAEVAHGESTLVVALDDDEARVFA